MESGNSPVVVRAFWPAVVAGAMVTLTVALSCSSDSGSSDLTCAAACVDAQNRATSFAVVEGPSSASACAATLSQIDTGSFNDPVCGDEVIQVASDGQCDVSGAAFVFEFDLALVACTLEYPLDPEEWPACVTKIFQDNGWPAPNAGCIECGITSKAALSSCVLGTEPLEPSQVADCAAQYARALGACEPSQ